MKIPNITLAMCAAAICAGQAGADLFIPLGSPEFAIKTAGAFHGDIGLGYDTKYISRGLAVSDSASSDNSVSFQGMGQYTLSDYSAIVGGLRYDWLAGKGFHHYEDGHLLCDEGTALLQYAGRLESGSIFALGYQFVHGGLPGRTNYHNNDGETRDFPFFDSSRPEEHSVVLDFHHEFSKCFNGFYWNSRVQYAFRWVEGWWFINTLGCRRRICERASIVAEASWTASAGYYDSHTWNSNGTQGYQLSLALPYQASEHVILSPFIGAVFIGNGAQAANDRRSDLYRDFSFVAGVSVHYQF